MSEILFPAYKQSSLSILMKSNYRTRLLLEVSQPKAAKKSDWRNPYEEGKNLPGSIEEDVVAESLYPEYNEKQIRRKRRMKYAPKSFVKKTRTSYPWKSEVHRTLTKTRKSRATQNWKNQFLKTATVPRSMIMEVAE